MGTATRPAKTFAGSWDTFADVDVFVDEVMAELAAMAKDGSRPTRSGPKPALAGAMLRKAVMAIWCVFSAACSGGPLDSCATSPLARFTDCSPAGLGSAFGVACSTGFAAAVVLAMASRRISPKRPNIEMRQIGLLLLKLAHYSSQFRPLVA
jgi:hypothetical protein